MDAACPRGPFSLHPRPPASPQPQPAGAEGTEWPWPTPRGVGPVCLWTVLTGGEGGRSSRVAAPLCIRTLCLPPRNGTGSAAPRRRPQSRAPGRESPPHHSRSLRQARCWIPEPPAPWKVERKRAAAEGASAVGAWAGGGSRARREPRSGSAGPLALLRAPGKALDGAGGPCAPYLRPRSSFPRRKMPQIWGPEKLRSLM